MWCEKYHKNSIFKICHFFYYSMIWTAGVSQSLIWTTTVFDLDGGLVAVRHRQSLPRLPAPLLLSWAQRPLLCQFKMCRPLAHLVRANAIFLIQTKLLGGFACEPVKGLRLHGERGGGFSLVFSQALLSLISLVPGPVNTMWAENLNYTVTLYHLLYLQAQA